MKAYKLSSFCVQWPSVYGRSGYAAGSRW